VAPPPPPPYPTQTYPPYGWHSPPPQKKNKNGCLSAVGIGIGAAIGVVGALVLIFVIVGAVILRSASTSPRKVGEIPPEGTVPGLQASPRRFKVGDVIQVGDWQLVVHGIQNHYTPPKGQYGFQQTADPGTHYVAADVEVTNTTQSVQLFLDLLLRIEDPAGHIFGLTPMLGVPDFPGENIDPGTSRRGLVFFQVPNTATSLDLVYQDSPFVPAVDIALP